MANVINLTPHPINLMGKGGAIVTVEPSGQIARVTTTEIYLKDVEIDKVVVPVMRTTFERVANLPEPDGTTWYIVSRIVKAACPDRDDLLVPTHVVRDENGTIICAQALSID